MRGGAIWQSCLYRGKVQCQERSRYEATQKPPSDGQAENAESHEWRRLNKYKMYRLAPLRRLICLDDCQLDYSGHNYSYNCHPRWKNAGTPVINDSHSVLPLRHFHRWCMGRDLIWAQEKGRPLLTKLAVLWPELSGRKIIAIKRMYRF